MSSDFRAVLLDGADNFTPSGDAGTGQSGPYVAFSSKEGGDVKVQTLRGDQITVYATIAGLIYPVGFKFMFQTGTTPTHITAYRAAGDAR